MNIPAPKNSSEEKRIIHVFALASFSYSFLLIFAQEFSFKSSLVPVLYLIYSSFTFLTSSPFGQLADKIGHKKVL